LGHTNEHKYEIDLAYNKKVPLSQLLSALEHHVSFYIRVENEMKNFDASERYNMMANFSLKFSSNLHLEVSNIYDYNVGTIGFALKKKTNEGSSIANVIALMNFQRRMLLKRFEIPNSSEVAWIITSPPL
jgi:hypothetical protein